MSHHPLLADFPVVIEQDVQWGEMDALNHVNNVVYFRYLENARIAYCRRIDWFGSRVTAGIGPILASVQARFRKPITFPDHLWIAARVLPPLGSDRFTMEHRIVSQKLDAVTTEAQSVLVSYHYPELRKVPLPEEVRKRIAELERWSVLPSTDE